MLLLRKYSVLLLVCSLIFSSSTFANLIINGSFEDTHVQDGRWAWFTSSNVDGWQGSNIEIWDSFQSFEAYDGEQLAELNAHRGNGDPFSIFQTFETEVGTTYEVSFAYSARKRNSEAFLFELATPTGTIYSETIDDHEVKTWFTFSTNFEAIDNWTTISFTSVTPYKGTVGNFLDDISVVAQSSLRGTSAVYAPPTLLLMLAGCGYLLLRRFFSSANTP